MSRVRKTAHDLASAELSAVESLLRDLKPVDVFARLSLEARRAEIEEQLRVADVDHEPMAMAELFFGGRPVLGSRGIEAEFAGRAVSKFQDLVTKLYVQQEGRPLAQRGPAPLKSTTTLHVTNIVRGSFGFMLEEINPQGSLVDTALKVAVDRASHLIGAFGDPSEEDFRGAVEDVDQRTLNTFGEFFKLLRQEEATMRVISGDVEATLTTESVDRAAGRADATMLEEFEEWVSGVLAGALPDSHMFEFRTLTERGIIAGKVSTDVATSVVDEWNRVWLGKEAKAKVHVKQVLREGAVVRERLTLLEIANAD